MMATQTLFVPAAEAAFIGGVTTQNMNRLFDEELVPGSLVSNIEGTRKFARLTAAFANFFFGTESFFSAHARRTVVIELANRVQQLQEEQQRELLLALGESALTFNWTYHKADLGATIDVTSFVAQACMRNRAIEDATQLVSENKQILGGLPCFAGTRVPIDTVLGSLEAGIDKDRLVASYPFLTDAHIEAARVFTQVHPRRGRPRRLADLNPNLPKVSKVVRRKST
jgi:uncharacterized protein (DUF433 family)